MNRFWLGAVHCLWFVIAWLGVHALIEIVPESTAHVGAKFEYLEKHKNDFEVIFLGSSRVFRGVDPALFDLRMAETGKPISSFNMGIPQMGGMETLHVLRRILGLESGRLRLVVVDPEYVFPYRWGSTLRDTSVHTLDNTLELISMQIALSKGMKFTDRLTSTFRHVNAYLDNVTQRGRISQAIKVAKNSYVELLGPASNGFATIEWSVKLLSRYGDAGNLVKRQRKFRLQHRFIENIALPRVLMVSKQPLPPLMPHEKRYLKELMEAARKSGVQLVFVKLPRAYQAGPRFLEAAQLEELVPNLFNYDDPERFPEFFAFENRWDRSHFNAAGARLMTLQLATDLAPYVRPAP